MTEDGKKTRAEYFRKYRKQMTAEQRAKKNLYQRRYYATHKEYFKQKQAEYWERKSQKGKSDNEDE